MDALRLHAARERELLRSVAKPHASRERELPELLVQAHRVVLGGKLRVETLLFQSRFPALGDVAADVVELPFECHIGLGGEPRLRERFLERLRAAEVSEYDVELANDEL